MLASDDLMKEIIYDLIIDAKENMCISCPHKCGEYGDKIVSDKGYYEWTFKAAECMERRVIK